ncbi:MAG: class I SAM-dependent methyltransferase [Betaproteobacteria bacterium]
MGSETATRTKAPSMDAESVFAEPLFDLGVENPAWAGIRAPVSSAGAEKVGVTAQFLEQADEYHRNYLDTGYWSFLLDNALRLAGVGAASTILDIGAGSGNSVIPLGERFPSARIVATDISPQLLAILQGHLRDHAADPDRFALVCVDAMDAHYRGEVADLAVGAAILHHIIDPARVIASCHRALKPGAWAIFVEPFEAGNTLVKIAYQGILARASAQERTGAAMQLLERMVADYTVRSRPKDDPIFRRLDDKWMFTRTYFERVRDEQGWAELIVHPINVSPSFVRSQAEVHLRLGAQLAPQALPPWAWSAIDDIDAGVSADLRGEWAPEAAVLLRKAGVVSPSPRMTSEARPR